MHLEIVRAEGVPAGEGHSAAELGAMQRAVLRLLERWELTDAQAATLLGDVSPRTIQRWRAGSEARISRDCAARMSNLLGIHKALRILFRSKTRGYEWIRRPNDTFGGQSALDVMLRGDLTDLMRVRRYLDAVRGAW